MPQQTKKISSFEQAAPEAVVIISPSLAAGVTAKPGEIDGDSQSLLGHIRWPTPSFTSGSGWHCSNTCKPPRTTVGKQRQVSAPGWDASGPPNIWRGFLAATCLPFYRELSLELTPGSKSTLLFRATSNNSSRRILNYLRIVGTIDFPLLGNLNPRATSTSPMPATILKSTRWIHLSNHHLSNTMKNKELDSESSHFICTQTHTHT